MEALLLLAIVVAAFVFLCFVVYSVIEIRRNRCETVWVSGHVWNGCTCKRCGHTRNAEHSWNGCTCKSCGTQRDEHHQWEGCICPQCGKVRDHEHNWHIEIIPSGTDGYGNGGEVQICTACGKTGDFTEYM